MTTGHRIRFRSLDRRCLETREAISAELDGEATELELAASRRHREECDDCRQFALAVTEATAAVRAAPALAPHGRPLRLSRRVSRRATMRSEEHTSELQSHVNLVCRLLLEKKKAHGL